MFCKNCGNQVSDEAVLCVKCGVPLKKEGVVIQEEGFDWLTTLLLCFFIGGFGVHRFYTKNTGIGIAQLLTLGGCGIWTLIDFITILTGSFKDGFGRPLVRK